MKKEFYKWVKIAGFASFVPFVLAAGPIGGFFVGYYLQQKFHFNKHFTLIFSLIGMLASFFETVRIIRAMLKAEK